MNEAEIVFSTKKNPFYNRKFTSSIGTTYNVEYSSIKKFIATKKLVILISKAKMVYWFPIDALENAELDSFKSFLNEKGIKVK